MNHWETGDYYEQEGAYKETPEEHLEE